MKVLARVGLACAVVAATLLGTVSPGAAAEGDLVVEIVGGGSAFDVDDLHPGYEAASVLSVRNASDEAGTIGLRIVGIVSDDNGCNRPESRVDTTCGEGEGELGDQVVMGVEREMGPGTFEPVIEPTVLSALGDGILLDDDAAAGSVDTYRLTVGLPISSGNETQTDTVIFDVEIFGRSSRADSTSVLGDSTSRSLVRGAADTVTLQSRAGTMGGLPRTGADLPEILAAGLASVMVGATVFGLSRRRRSALPTAEPVPVSPVPASSPWTRSGPSPS